MHPKNSSFQLMIHTVGDHPQARKAASQILPLIIVCIKHSIKKRRGHQAIYYKISVNSLLYEETVELRCQSKGKDHKFRHALFLIGPRIPGGSCSLCDQVIPPSNDLFMAPLHLNKLCSASDYYILR
jgi:hypothetical protein